MIAKYGGRACGICRISVVDEGAGIPRHELSPSFDKFVQSGTTKSGAGGTGLGLAICREIVYHHEGRIWAENNPKRGATCVLLPRRSTSPAGRESRPSRGRPGSRGLSAPGAVTVPSRASASGCDRGRKGSIAMASVQSPAVICDPSGLSEGLDRVIDAPRDRMSIRARYVASACVIETRPGRHARLQQDRSSPRGERPAPPASSLAVPVRTRQRGHSQSSSGGARSPS